LELGSGQSRRLLPGFDHAISDPSWDSRGRIVFSYDRHGETHVARIDPRRERIEVLARDLGGTSMGRPYPGGGFSVAGERIAYTLGTALAPAEVGLIDRGRARTLTDLNSDLLPQRELARIEEIWTKSSHDGLDIQSWIALPPGFDPAKKYPLLLEIHGGPYANYGPRFAPEIQLYASAGYVVLYSNPRGSTRTTITFPLYSRRSTDPGLGNAAGRPASNAAVITVPGPLSGAFGALSRISASSASSTARRRARSERPPSRSACIRQTIRFTRYCLWFVRVGSPKTSA